MNIEERVNNGIEWLDTNYPDWYSRVDFNKLRMEDCSGCVLGQLTGSYYKVVHCNLEYTGYWAAQHGFNFANRDEMYEMGYRDDVYEGDCMPSDYKFLTDYYLEDLGTAWKSAIIERRNTKNASVASHV